MPSDKPSKHLLPLRERARLRLLRRKLPFEPWEKLGFFLRGAAFTLMVGLPLVAFGIAGVTTLLGAQIVLVLTWLIFIGLVISWPWFRKHKRYGLLMIVLWLAVLIGMERVISGGKRAQEEKEQYRDILARRSPFNGRILDPCCPVILYVGENVIPFRVQDLTSGINLYRLPMFNRVMGKQTPAKLKFYEENNQLLIDAEIYDADGSRQCIVTRNQLGDLNPRGYDSNYALNALEIVDASKQPILQLLVLDSNMIFMGCRFDLTGGRRLWAPLIGGVTYGSSYPPNMPEFRRLFKYPSSQHSGEFETQTLEEITESLRAMLLHYGFPPGPINPPGTR